MSNKYKFLNYLLDDYRYYYPGSFVGSNDLEEELKVRISALFKKEIVNDPEDNVFIELDVSTPMNMKKVIMGIKEFNETYNKTCKYYEGVVKATAPNKDMFQSNDLIDIVYKDDFSIRNHKITGRIMEVTRRDVHIDNSAVGRADIRYIPLWSIKSITKVEWAEESDD